MSSREIIYCSFASLLLMISSSCSNTKYLSGDQRLYTGQKTIILSDTGRFSDKSTRKAIESVASYPPNNAIGNRRMLPPFGLWIYNYRKPREGNKPRWLYRTFAREPVLISTVEPELRSRKIESELFASGYFHARVESSVDSARRNPRKASITYYVEPGRPFRFNDISFKSPADEVDSIILSARDNFSIKPDDIFSLDAVKSESNRISSMIINAGYYYFNTSNLELIADTSQLPYRLDLMVGKKNESMMANAGRKFRIGTITVRITDASDSTYPEIPELKSTYDGIDIVSRGIPVRYELISRSIHFRPGDLYSNTNHQQTLTHLNSYGLFKFINFKYTPGRDSSINLMDVELDLTQIKNISLDLEANVVNKSTGFKGPGFAAILTHGNLARGGNKLQLKLDGGVEWQAGGSSMSPLGTTSYNLGFSSSLVFPGIIVPFNLFSSKYLPLSRTTVSAGFELLSKIRYYRMRSFNFGYGYQWSRKEKISSNFYPVYINSVELVETTAGFDSVLNNNLYIRKSFEEQFIAGLKYEFIYDNNLKLQPHGFYFHGGISTSGNLIDLLHRQDEVEEQRSHTILNSVYSQFMKVSADVRYYRKFSDNSLVFRFYSGIGLSYGNSTVMPYVEQFFSGGSNSIRSFVARSLGPGALIPDTASVIVDQTGDIKLEGNAEFRFKLSRVLNGALFVDAGNIWLLRADEIRPGTGFQFDTFADQIYVGAGMGLRFDFGFFVLRTDLGFPLRRAYPIDNSNWVKKPGEVLKGAVFNLSIGYPF